MILWRSPPDALVNSHGAPDFRSCSDIVYSQLGQSVSTRSRAHIVEEERKQVFPAGHDCRATKI
jgi:hypothetical protein